MLFNVPFVLIAKKTKTGQTEIGWKHKNSDFMHQLNKNNFLTCSNVTPPKSIILALFIPGPMCQFSFLKRGAGHLAISLIIV